MQDNKGMTPLDTAIKSRAPNTNILKLLLSKSKELDVQDKLGRTPLHRIILGSPKEGLASLVSQVIADSGALDVRDRSDRTILITAIIKNRQYDVIKAILDNIPQPSLARHAFKGHDVLSQCLREQLDSDAIKLVLSKSNTIDERNRTDKGSTPLHLACSYPLPKVTSDIVSLSRDVNKLDYLGYAPIHYAVALDNIPMIVELGRAHANLESRVTGRGAVFEEHDGLTPLLVIFAHNRRGKAAFEVLLDLGVDINAKDVLGWGVVHFGSLSGREELLRMLMAMPSTNFTEKCIGDSQYDKVGGVSALHIAALEGSREGIEMLLDSEYFPDIDVLTDDGSSPLLYAVSSDKTEIVSVLLGRGASPMRPNKAGLTATLQAYIRNKRDIIELIEAFKDRSADYGEMPTSTETKPENCGLTFAAKSGEITFVRKLLDNFPTPLSDRHLTAIGEAIYAAVGGEKMSCIALLSGYGNGPIDCPERQLRFTCTEGPKTYESLHLAVSKGNMDIVTLLLKNGANINGMNRQGVTALQTAAARGDLKMIRELVKQGAFIHSRDHEFQTPILIAARERSFDAVKLLYELGANLEDQDCWGLGALYHSCGSPLMDWVMENSDWKAWRCRDGGTILHHSMTPRTFEGCPLMLIQRGADILQPCDYYGYPLHCALWHAKDSIATEILRLTPPNRLKDVLDYQSIQFGTALYTAASRFGCAKLVELVLDAGADINLADNKEGTALNISCVNGDLATVKIFLSRGARVCVTNSKRETKSALEIARRPTSRKCPQIIQLLEKYQAEQAEEEQERHLAALTGLGAANTLRQPWQRTPPTPASSSQESDIALIEKSELLDLQ